MDAYNAGNPKEAFDLFATQKLTCEAANKQAPDACWEVLYYYLSSALYLDRNALVVREAKIYLQEATAIFGEVSQDRGWAANLVAIALKNQNRFDEAEDYYRLALEQHRKASAHDPSEIAAALNNLGVFYDRLGKPWQSEPLYREAHAIWVEREGAGSHQASLGLGAIARSLQRQGRLTEAAEQLRSALAFAESMDEKHIDVATWRSNFASILEDLGQFAAAEREVLASLAVNRDRYGPDHRHSIINEIALARIYATTGRTDRALSLLEKIDARGVPDISDLRITVAIGSADIAALAGDPQAEMRYLNEGLEWVGRHPGLNPNNAIALRLRMARRALTNGDIAVAEGHFAAMADIAGSDDHQYQAEASLIGAQIAYARDDLRQALRLYERASDLLARSLPADHPRSLEARLGVARSMDALGGDDRTAATARLRALRADASDRLALYLTEKGDFGAEQDLYRHVFLAELDHLSKRWKNAPGTERAGLLEEAFLVAQLASQRSAGRAAARSALRLSLRDTDLGELERERVAIMREIEAREAALVVARGAGAEADRVAELAAALVGLQETFEELTARLEKERPGMVGYDLLRPIPLHEAQAALAPGTLLLLTVPGGSEVAAFHVFALSHEDRWWIRLDIEEADRLRQTIDMLRAEMTAGGSTVRGRVRGEAAGPLADMAIEKAGQRLGELLFRDLPLREFDRILAVQNGAAATIPLAIARTGGDWMVDSHTITQLPNIAALTAPRPTRGLRTKKMLAVGAVRNDASRLPPLVHARRQLEAMRKSKVPNIVVRTGDEASEPAVVEAIRAAPSANLLFATHTVADASLTGTGQPALLLNQSAGADGFLTLDEIRELRLNGALVILSACDTAMRLPHDQDPLSSFARAFLAAGASGVMVSHWPIDDAGAGVFIDSLMAKIASGTEYAQALRQAAMTMRETENGRWSHPRHWAAMSFVTRSPDQ